MNKIILLVLIIISISVYSLEITSYDIPGYSNDLPLDSFTDMAIDGSTGNLCLTGPGIWCEIPLKDNEPDWDKSFTASTGDYQLTAAAGRDNGVTVFDKYNYRIMDEENIYGIDDSGIEPSCMEYSGYVLLMGSRYGTVSSWEIRNGMIEMTAESDCSIILTGIAAAGSTVFLSDSNNIYRCDIDYNIEKQFEPDFAVNGIAVSGSVLWAVGMNENKIYRLEGVYQ
ncbi:MAG: hypothetical protein SVK54_00565 [candidate division WOR-3 bacterium]|nr:hypothetical protein [candidate division WOR-3 bacterium]